MSDDAQDQESGTPGTVGGGWLGTYAYKGALRGQPPMRFEASLSEPDGDGGFSGTILDDGGLGEADVKGGQSGLGVRFSKTYRRRGQSAVSYEGTLSEDGRTLQGTWQISAAAHGVWDARRAWSENGQADAAEEAEEEALVEYAVGPREVVRLG